MAAATVTAHISGTSNSSSGGGSTLSCQQHVRAQTSSTVAATAKANTQATSKTDNNDEADDDNMLRKSRRHAAAKTARVTTAAKKLSLPPAASAAPVAVVANGLNGNVSRARVADMESSGAVDGLLYFATDAEADVGAAVAMPSAAVVVLLIDSSTQTVDADGVLQSEPPQSNEGPRCQAADEKQSGKSKRKSEKNSKPLGSEKKCFKLECATKKCKQKKQRKVLDKVIDIAAEVMPSLADNQPSGEPEEPKSKVVGGERVSEEIAGGDDIKKTGDVDRAAPAKMTTDACEELIEFIEQSYQSINKVTGGRDNGKTVWEIYECENKNDNEMAEGGAEKDEAEHEHANGGSAQREGRDDDDEENHTDEQTDRASDIDGYATASRRLINGLLQSGRSEAAATGDHHDEEKSREQDDDAEMRQRQDQKKVQTKSTNKHEHRNQKKLLQHQQQQQQQQQQSKKLTKTAKSDAALSSVISKALQSKLTPLAPPFHPAAKTVATSAASATILVTTTVAASTSSPAATTTAAAAFHSYEQHPTIVYNMQQLSLFQQQVNIQQQYLQQQQQLQQNRQQQVTYLQPIQAVQQPQHLQPISANPQQQHFMPQQQQQLHQPHCAQHASNILPHVYLHTHAPALGNNATINNSNNNCMQQLATAPAATAAAAPSHAHLIPLQVISLAASATPQSSAMSATAASAAVASVAGGAWSFLEAPMYIDANGEYRPFCPAHGPPPPYVALVGSAGSHGASAASAPQPSGLQASCGSPPSQHGATAVPFQLLTAPTSASASSSFSTKAAAASTSASAPSLEPRVLLQLDAGVALPLQVSGKRKVIRGPTTVQMVSQNRPPPMPVPVQVPQGQVMQQYLNESGTLTHVVLSPQQYQQLHAGQGHIHAPFLTANGTSHFYSPLPAGFPTGPGGGPTHFHAIPGGGHLQPQPPPPPAPQQQQTTQQQLSHSPHSLSPPNNYHKDERTQRQHTKLLRKLDQKQREMNSAMSTPAHSPSPRKNDINGHHNNYISSSINTSNISMSNNTSISHVGATIQTATTTTTLTSTNSQHNHHHATAPNHHQQQQQHPNNHHNARRTAAQRNGTYAVSGALQLQQHNQHLHASGGASSVGTSEDGEESSSVAEDEDDFQATIVEQLSAIQKPEVIDITSRSAKIIWEAPANTDPLLINHRDLRYNVLLSDRAKECKYKSLYKGESYDCIVQDLQPGQEYVVRLQVHFEKLQGTASEPTEFTTPACEPDQPMPPKLVVRTKNSLHLRWTNPHANGSPVQHYLLEYDEGKTGTPASSRSARQHAGQLHFVEAVKTKGKQYILTKLQPSTIYNFRLAAVNEVGSSLYSPICTYSTSGNPPATPKPPTLQAVTSTSLRLVWERRQQDVEFVLQMLDREHGHNYLNLYNGTDCIYECCQLRRATSYQFRLRADNDAGVSPWSNEVTFKTAPERPGCPGKPQVKGKIHGTYFRVRWDPPGDRGGAEILRYFLEICSGPKFERIYSGPDPEATCDRVQPGTTYQLRASCEGPAGISAYSEVATITSEAIVPAAPSPPYYENLPGPYAAVLRFDKPEFNGGAPILEYEIQVRRCGTAKMETEVAEQTVIYHNKDSYCVAKDLQPGCGYEAQARAINRIGAGAWSTWFKFTSAAAPPSPPTSTRVAIKSATQLSVNWLEPECNGSAISEYRLESAAVSGEQPAVNESVLTSSSFQTCYQGLQTSVDLRNLLPFTLYYFRVNASNVAGVSKWSPLVNAKTPAAIPAAPQIKDYEFTANEVALSWSQPECNGAPITAYTIEYAERCITTPDAATEYTITDLTPESSYKLRVQAVNPVGAGPFSSYVKLTTLPPPPAPPSLECTGVGHNFIKLKWGDGKNLDFTKFYVEMYVQRAKEFQVVYSGTNCMCKVNKLQEQTSYTFRICAGTDRAGVGDYSSEYVFRTTATLPSSIKTPRVVFEGGVCLLAPGSSALTGAAANVPSAQLPETPSSFIAGLGNLSLGVPLTLEWQHSKNSFSDRVEYVLQYAIGRDGDFKQIYRGPETKFTIENLEPGCTYQFRVCPIRVSSSGDLSGQFTSAFRYQVPDLPSIDVIDGSLLSSAAGMLGAGLNASQSNSCNNNCNSNAPNASFHGHSHHAHHAHHSHGHHSHHAHNHAHHSHHNSRHNGGSSSSSSTASTLHHRSVSASAVTSSGGGGNLFTGSGGNAIGLIPLGSSMTSSEIVANFNSCDDPHHHHHHHHHAHQFHGGVAGSAGFGGDHSHAPASTTASLLAATASTLLAHNPLLTNAAAATHVQNGGAIRRFAMKLTSLYTNRKRFTDQEKAVIFMVSFLFIAFVFAALVKMLMR